MTVLQAVLFVACSIGFLLVCAYAYESIAERRDAKQHPPPGKLIQVGDRRLHLSCQGSDWPTVVIEQGAGSPSRHWWPIQQKIAEFARVCTYDRAGYLWSEPVRGSRSVGERAQDLHALLTNAGLPGPYLFVAHSYGGLIVRDFALRYPARTAGLILVDTPDEPALRDPEVQKLYARITVFMKILETTARFALPRLLRQVPFLREGLQFVRPDEYAAAADDLASLRRLDSSSPTPGQLGGMPLVVVTHGQPFPGPFAVLEKDWLASQHRLVALSSQATLITAQHSNHMIHLEQPDVIVDVVRQMHTAISRSLVDPPGA